MIDTPWFSIMREASQGRFPHADGSIQFPNRPPGRMDAVVAFTAHHVIAVEVDPDEARRHLTPGDLSAPMQATFLVWLASKLGTEGGNLDALLAIHHVDSGPPVSLTCA